MRYLSKATPKKRIRKLYMLLWKMLNFKQTESRQVIRTTQQIDTKVMHSSETFRQNVLVKLYFRKDLNFLVRELIQKKISV